MASVMRLHFSMQKEDILEHINGKCPLCTLWSACRPSYNIGMHLINTIEHTHAELLVSSLEPSVMRCHLYLSC